jgi:peptidoglycan/LPS O-acetylase OafA/YrhL
MELTQIQIQSEEKTGLKLKNRENFFQIDAMKAIMIALVIMDHTFTHDFLHQYGSVFWERISIPILMIIMGFNMGKSFSQKGECSLKERYSRSYFENKIKRYMIPYLLLYLAHGIIRIIVTLLEIAVNKPETYDNFNFRYLGFTFFYGPGLWFIPVLFGSILLFPLLYHYFKKRPTLTIVGTFFVELVMQGIMIGLALSNDFDLPDSVFFFLYNVLTLSSAIGIGLWLSEDHKLNSKRNRVFWILSPLSLIYMIYYFLGLPGLAFGDYNYFFFPYSAMLFMLGMKFIPKNPQTKFSNFIRKVSKSTYHILLTQIFYFSIVFQFFLVMTDGNSATLDVFDANPINYLWFYPINLIITFGVGIVWQNLEQNFYQKVKSKLIYKKIYKILISLAVIAYVAWIVGNILFFFAI